MKYVFNARNRAVGDPCFASIENIAPIISSFCSSFHARRIGPVVRFSQALTGLKHLRRKRCGSSALTKHPTSSPFAGFIGQTRQRIIRAIKGNPDMPKRGKYFSF